MNYSQRPMQPATTPASPSNKNLGAENSTNETVQPARNPSSGDGLFAFAGYSPATERHSAASVKSLLGRQATERSAKARRERIRLLSVSMVTIFYLAFLGLMLQASTGQPSTGLIAKQEADGRLLVSWVVPVGMAYDRGVRPGDEVIKQGIALPGNLTAGEEIDLSNAQTLQVVQGEKQITLSTDHKDGNNQLRRWGYTVIALIFVFVGAPVYVKARQRKAATSFYIFCVATAVALALAMVAFLLYGWALALQFVSMLVVAASFVTFFYQFPVPVSKTREQLVRFITVLAGAASLILLGYLWVMVTSPGNYALIQPIYYLFLASCGGAGFFRLLTSFVGERSPDIRRQHSLLVIGTALAVGPSVLLGLLPSLILGRPIVSMETTAFTLAFLPVFFAYAITQHQLLGIRGFVRRSVVYVIMGFSVLSAFFMVAALANAVLPKGWSGEEGGILGFGLFIFLIAISFGYVQKRVEWMVDRFIYHDAYDYKEALLQFSTQLAAEQDLNVLSQELVGRTCRMMNLDCGALLLVIHPGEVSGMVARNAPSNHQSEPAIITDTLSPVDLEALGINTPTMMGTLHTWSNMRGKETLPNVHEANGDLPHLLTYAQYGECDEWLPQSLQFELSRLGMDLRHTNAPTQQFNFYAGPSRASGPLNTGALTRRPGDPEDTLLHKLTGARHSYADGSRQFLGIPLWTRQQFVGILCLGSKTTGEHYSKDDLSLLTTLGGQAALAIYNAQLYEMREQALLDTITALAHAIEAKDTYTLNHCEKITGRAVALAQSLGLPNQEVVNIRLGSILHDVGKIGVPDAILNKPARLTDEEYERIKEHAVIGARIVQSVGALQGVVPIIRHHQERYDGSGYPDGLKGDGIPLGARIISVVDAYGAMTEDRVYRKAPGHQVAISELKRFAGKQFDPFIAEAFIRLLEVQPELSDE